MEFNPSLIGTVIGTITVITTVTIIWLLTIIKQADLYVAVSWLLTIPTMTVFLLSYIYGFEVTTSFVAAYLALSWIPLFLGLNPGIEAQSVLSLTSIIITVEFIFLLIFQFISKLMTISTAIGTVNL
ncbi:hypothetical protein Riv7116_4795 [Rivularia sp. PCC 7116]|uniref:hypothetical protein n=1 Tax=Rivularia sp. PCC 7116 TaxID=373994 RepID=UPI00029ED9D9|nr:hypothetical protein [Rivularia sp. PCC 7116]AFY57208.1 hypothetical protein Riv7116_4795 [Rivularia sp. PCC 7116]